jgi:hypothetical protein
MRIICIEEHALDPDITKAAQPALFLEGLPVSDDDRENMAHRNAESLLGLDVP